MGSTGFGGDALLRAAGIDLADVEAAGGTITRHEQPFDSVADLRDGRADLMISEGIMTPDGPGWPPRPRSPSSR